MIFEKIEELCKNQGISVAYLEKKLGFGNGTIRSWTKCSPSVEKIKKVADHFGVSIESILKD